MKVKKFLKKRAQEDIESVQTDTDQEILQRLKNSVAEEKLPARRNLKWLWTIPSGAVACAVAAVMIVELVPFSGSDLGGARYDEMNFEHTDSDLFELSNALTNLTLHFTENQAVSVVKTSDSISGDAIYYALTVDESSMEAVYSMRLLIVVNENYDYDSFEMEGTFVTETYSDYSITYRQQITNDAGVNLVQCRAQIDSAKYEMYVLDYREYSFDNGTFLTVINNILDFHS